ncbi:MAG: glycosyltransferase family 39 protein [Chloroflexota bacterium]
MQGRKYLSSFLSIELIILVAAAVKFSLHMYIAPGYGLFADEFYTIALSKHLAFGYVDLPPLVPALVALSRFLLGESLLAMHVFPALAGSVTLVFICLITREFGGKTFAVALSALGFLIVPIWLSLDSIFCYDSIDQMILAGFLFVLVRFLRTGDRRLWIVLGTIAGIACNAKMTILFLGPGFLLALLLSKYRRDLLTRWPWLGAALCLILVTPYLLWQVANDWPTLEYWIKYGTLRLYEASLLQYLMSLLYYMNPLLLPLWIAGLYRIFRPIDGVHYGFLGWMFLFTLTLMFQLHAAARMLPELFIPLLAAGAVFMEERFVRTKWMIPFRAVASVYLLVGGILVVPLSLPILPFDQALALVEKYKYLYPSIKEFNGSTISAVEILAGRIGWDKSVREVARVYDGLPAEERTVAGIYTDVYPDAGAIDELGPQYGLPHVVSGHLTYYLWGPGYSWDIMIIVTGKANHMSIFFDECELKSVIENEQNSFMLSHYIFVCRKPKVPAEAIWSSMQSFR